MAIVRRRHAGALCLMFWAAPQARDRSCEAARSSCCRAGSIRWSAPALAREAGFAVIALTVDYNQRHRVELEAARDDRGRACRPAHRPAARPARVRRVGADRATSTVPKDGVGRGHPGHLRAGAQHDLPEPRARPRRGERRARHLHRRQRARLFGLSRLPARVHRRVRAAGQSRDQGGRRGRAASPSTRRSAHDQGRHRARGGAARARRGAQPQLLRPAARRPRIAASATPAGCAPRASPRPGIADPTVYA